MAKIALIRCYKYEIRCPLTGCLQCLKSCTEGFSTYVKTELMGVFTCQCPGDNVVEMANILTASKAQPTCPKGIFRKYLSALTLSKNAHNA